MAAVIRYLSADNHPADTTAFSSPETGRHTVITCLFHAVKVVFEMSITFTFLLLCGVVTVSVYGRYTE